MTFVKRTILRLAVLSLMLLATGACSIKKAERPMMPIPLPRAHAHNDYAHIVPLYDALSEGFMSIEADVHLVDGKLLVAHDLDKVSPNATLRTMYLEPLKARIQENSGFVYWNKMPITLFVDFKSAAEPTYKALREELADYSDLLTCFSEEGCEHGAITVIISGNRPIDFMKSEKKRLAAVDGRLSDLYSDVSSDLIPIVSDNWGQHFKWRGAGEMPQVEKKKLLDLTRRAHSEGRKVRFWATPDAPGAAREAVWMALLECGVDMINTDDLSGLRVFLAKHDPPVRVWQPVAKPVHTGLL